MLGLGLSARGDYTAAIDEFRTALSINPGMYQAMINLGYTYEKMGRYKDAIDEYQAVLAVSPGQENVKRWIAELKIKNRYVIFFQDKNKFSDIINCH
jgi:tetratricopeptide (TPR) repeat protein